MADADQGKQDPADGRTDDFRQVVGSRVQRQGADDGFLRDQGDDQRLLGRRAHGADDGNEDDENHDVPELDPAGKDQQGENQSLQEVQRLAPDEQLQPIHPVGDHAADRPEHKARGELKKADEPQIKGGLGQLPYQPILDHEMDVLAGLAWKVADGEETKLAMTKRRGKLHVNRITFPSPSGLFFGVEPFMSRLGQMSAQNSPAKPKHRAVEHEQHDGHPDEEGQIPAGVDQGAHRIDHVSHGIHPGDQPHPKRQGIQGDKSGRKKSSRQGGYADDGEEVTVVLQNKGKDQRDDRHSETEKQTDPEESQNTAESGSDADAKNKSQTQ